ncbi:MAG: DUF2336 domain-containing protein [Proteobacteria bacterium]|nr:DUF2336 domain-containing protein [Pseudomonadota bacterium]
MSAAGLVARDGSYQKDRRDASDPDPNVRRQLAVSATRPEILYFLAEDKSAEVRREVAANVKTPTRADALLAHDPDVDVRAMLAGKIARLLPGLAPGAHDKLNRRVIDILETLARDEAVRVRQMLSEALQNVASASPDLIRQLAHDSELSVAEPVLRFSPLLTDQDLLDIIAASPQSERVAIIAKRVDLAADVSDAVVATHNAPAVAALLANPSAQIREETLDLIIEQAPPQISWHEPLVTRPTLPVRAARRIAAFIADALLKKLEGRPDLDTDARRLIAAEVRKRLAAKSDAAAEDSVDRDKQDEAEARRLYGEDKLDEDVIGDAIDQGRRTFVRTALALLGSVGPDVILKVFGSGSPKGVTALAWKAGLSMHTAVQMQLRLGGIAPKQLLSATRGGEYPLSTDEMIWHLEFFGAKAS